MLDYKGIVAVISTAIFVIFLFPAIYALNRKCFSTSFPWLALTLFATLRIIGNAFQLALEIRGFNQHLSMGAAICNSVGLGPLFLVSTRLLTQFNAFIYKEAVPNQTHRALFTFELCTIISTVVTIVGGVQTFSSKNLGAQDTQNTSSALQAGVCLYAATLACISGAALVIFSRRNKSSASRKQPHFRLCTCFILVGMVLLAIRLIYSLLSVFAKNSAFSLYGNGNETAQICLQCLPEWLVTFLYLTIAFLMREAVPPPKEKAIETEKGGMRQILRYLPFVHWFIR